MVSVTNAQAMAAAVGGIAAGIVVDGRSARNDGKFSQRKNAFFGGDVKRARFSENVVKPWVKSQGVSRTSVGPLRVVAEKVAGIDLGTTNSAVAAMVGGKPTIVTNAEGQRTTPSVVAYIKNGNRLVGQIAKRQAVFNPTNTFLSVKRFIGRKMNEVDDEAKQVPYQVIRDPDGDVKLDCPAIGKTFAAEEICAQVLRKLVDDASKFLNDKAGVLVGEVIDNVIPDGTPLSPESDGIIGLENWTLAVEKVLKNLKAEQGALRAEQATLKAELAALKAEQAALEAEQAALLAEQAALLAEQAALEAEQAALET